MNLRATGMVLRNSLMQGLEYRTDYMMLVFSGVLSLVLEWAVLNAVYGARDMVGALPRERMLGFVILGIALRSSQQLWSLSGECIAMIRDGSFRKFLVQPMHFPTYFFSMALGPKLPTWAMSLTLLLVCKFSGLAPNLFTNATLLPAVIAAGFSIVVLWQIYLMIVLLGFWIEEASFLNITVNIGTGFFAGTMLPLSWLPVGLQHFAQASPFIIIGHFPVSAALGILHPGEFQELLMKALGWTLGLWILNRFLYKKGTAAFEAFGG